MWFTTISKGDAVETKILSDLFHVSGEGLGKSSKHKWTLYITDILDSALDLHGNNCDFLQTPYDPDDVDGVGCVKGEQPSKCAQGDLAGKFGEVTVGKRRTMFTRAYHTDLSLEMPELDGPRSIFLVVHDAEHPEAFLACARVREVKTKVADAEFSRGGVEGRIRFSQASPFHPVTSEIDLDLVRQERLNFAPAGHYSRPDVTKLIVNRRRQSTVKFEDM